MPAFQYRGRNQRGEAVKGTLDGASADAVAAQLFNSGVIPVDISLARAGDDVLAALPSLRIGGDKVHSVDVMLFSRQMHTLLKAGVPILQALRGLRESSQNPAMSTVITRIAESLDSGLDFTTALKRHPKVFSSLYVSLVQVGEVTGSLAEVFLQLAEYLERERDTADRVKAATRYPIFVVVAMFIGIMVVNLFVVPAFAKIYSNFKTELPWATKALIASSNFTLNYWYIIFGAIALAFVGLRVYVNTPPGRYRWHRLKLKVPVIGPLMFKTTLARFARSLAVMIRSGVPIVQGMSVVSRAVDNEFIGERILQIRDGVERGESIARTAAATGMFPPLVIQMIAVGEETGALDALMFNVAEYYERETDYAIKNLATAIQPILLVFLGALVLVLALGVFLPMWDMVQFARKG